MFLATKNIIFKKPIWNHGTTEEARSSQRELSWELYELYWIQFANIDGDKIIELLVKYSCVLLFHHIRYYFVFDKIILYWNHSFIYILCVFCRRQKILFGIGKALCLGGFFVSLWLNKKAISFSFINFSLFYNLLW